MPFEIRAACDCNIGNARGNNEDNFLFDGTVLQLEHRNMLKPLEMAKELNKPTVLAVFDGMGGENYGEYASFHAASELQSRLKRVEGNEEISRAGILDLCQRMNDAVNKAKAEKLTSYMGTTMVALIFDCSSVVVVNIGDSRAYRLRGDTMRQISMDHVSNMAMEGGKAPLTQNLGMNSDDYAIDPFIAKGSLADGDIYLLCSDGITDMVGDRDIIRILSSGKDVKEITAELVAAALRNGGRDNITAIVCRVTGIGQKDSPEQ